MAVQRLVGTNLDRIAQSASRVAGYRVLLFDLYQDTITDIVLQRHQQVPIDVTSWITGLQITQSHDTEANQCQFTMAGTDIDWRLLMFSWLVVYEGDLRVSQDQWPIVFSGVLRGQPSRQQQRGEFYVYQHTAYDRSVFYRTRRHTSGRVWLPTDTDADIGDVLREFATNTDWGMGLDPSEVLFGKQFYRVAKKLQIVDIPAMEALTEILSVVHKQPAFNGEGKLVARSMDLDRPVIRIHSDNTLIQSVNIPQQSQNLPSSVRVKGLDYRATRLDYKRQKLMGLGPITIGFFNPRIVTKQSFSENNDFRAVVDQSAYFVKLQGSLLAQIFSFDSSYDIEISNIDDFNCQVVIEFDGVYIAILVVTLTLGAYIGLKVLGAEIGAKIPILGWVVELAATIVLLLIMDTLKAIGQIEFEVWGTPFEYVYRELDAKAILADTDAMEDEEHEVNNSILSTLDECEEFARVVLRRKTAEVAQRSITVASDPLLEPNDIIELIEEGEIARYYVVEIQRNMARGGSEPTYQLNTFRAR